MVTLAVAAGLASLLVIVALGFGFAALYVALATITSPPAAAIAAAGTALALALATIAVGQHVAYRLARKLDERPTQCGRDHVATELRRELAKEAASFAVAHPRLSIVGCLLVGYVLGANPNLRTGLQDIIETL